MKEWQEIIRMYKLGVESGQKMALATVVHVEGSSYRRPGARMLVTETGNLTGAISGGCLEGDALKKAQLVIFQQSPKLVTYDTTDEDDEKFGIGLGCNGIIQVLIEPIDPLDPLNPIIMLEKCLENRTSKVLVTVFSLHRRATEQLGTCLLFAEEDQFEHPKTAVLEPTILLIDEAKKILKSGKPQIKYLDDEFNWTVFYEVVKPPIQLIIVGAGNDTLPLNKMAHTLGWDTIILDGRSNHATLARFPNAKDILVYPAEEAIQKLEIDRHTAVVLMTHNFEYDLVILSHILAMDFPYLGVLGPKKKMERMLAQLEKKGIQVENFQLKKLHAPIGLDLGAETSEEIALSILAEIQAINSQSTAGFLKDKQGPIHEDYRANTNKIPTSEN
ncbi:XdhC family protein [Pararhodonellum marinum]|uniref:XdhC family protein n=1 Tax=Pararhodonellum marinum TaxID=2755358 RepID=UPI00188F5850|nr:XdhC/CoxI family protein [Pararhodonellum marinum]